MSGKKRKIDDFFRRVSCPKTAGEPTASTSQSCQSEHESVCSESESSKNAGVPTASTSQSCQSEHESVCSESATSESCPSHQMSMTESSAQDASYPLDDYSQKNHTPDTRRPWDEKKCHRIITDLFGSKTIHCYYTCPSSSCSAVSANEVARLRPKRFCHSWINKTNWWLCYVEGEGMFCLACKKHCMRHLQNSREAFSGTPSVRLKQDALKTHSKSALHSAAIESEMLQSTSCFHQELTKQSEIEASVLEKSFSTAYFLMKQLIANCKFEPLLNFIQSVCGDDSLHYFQHRSEGSRYEIFQTLGDTLKMEVVDKVKDSLAYGLLTDEVCDISVTENLVTFVQFFCRKTSQVETMFLSCQNVLADHSSADAKSITALLLQELKDSGLDVSKLTGFASDGAAVMTGKKGGVAALLRKENACLVNIHCICHRLALSCTDSNESISYVKTVETLLRQLWQFFENSPKKMAAYMKMQMRLKSIVLDNAATRQVGKRLKKACRTRWLSLDASVSAVRHDFEAILHTLSLFEEQDATAHGLLRRIRCLKFLGAIYILYEVLPILSGLSRYFQKGSLNFSAVLPAVTMTKDKLAQLKDEESPIQRLSQDIDSYTNMCAEIKLNDKESKELKSLLNKYIDSLIINIDRRFSDSSEVVAAFSIFDPTVIPPTDDVSFQTYGNNQINVLAKHFFPEDIKEEKLKAQWQGMKYHIVDILKPNMPPEVHSGAGSQTPTEWLLLQLLRSEGLRHFFHEVIFIAEVAASLPVSNAWPERGASTLKLVKTKQRNRLNSRMLECLLHVSINGPPVEKSSQLIKQAVKIWLDKKTRRKLPKKGKVCVTNTGTKHVMSPQLQDASIQTDEAMVYDRDTVRAAIKEMLLDGYGSDEDEDLGDDEDEW